MKFMKQKFFAVPALLLGASASAFAALPASVATTVTAAQSDASDMFDLIFPVIGVIVGMTLVIKLFKRFTAKI
ncbi:major coat protein [Vogesella indigofera]|uniref:major coat protein n=1 Tax=Vogesella indigofera TaxID=45465 RepID=UPI00234E59BC|nr:major coat protein [Vogesella indigofera]MDC7700378.1 hypothetical protein [Vogesella indigofera]